MTQAAPSTASGARDAAAAVQAAAELVARMEMHAAAGDWDDVAQCANRLRVAILEVPEHQRRAILLAAQRGVQKVHSQVQAARSEIASRISALHRGKDMAAAYGVAD